MVDTTTVDYSLWALELARDEYSDSAYDFQRAQQQVQRLQAERRRLIAQSQQMQTESKTYSTDTL